MKRTLLMLALIALIVPAGVDAQGRGRRNPNGAYGIPPGQLPPPGLCRVWYDGVPPGRQPRAMSCREAEVIAARNPQARVIYGEYGETAGRTRDPYPRTYPGGYPGQSGNLRYDTPGFHIGYKDGYDQGLEDARGNDPYDPARQGRYRSADHDYNNKYGSKDEYRNAYREGFRAGYDAGYREIRGARVRGY
jgi:hypothetical protein